jgi:GDP-4-dehydro-6-deoxy-D-mannose reductase
MNKVLIFGVGGFVGSYLAQEFFEAGYRVYGSDVKRPETVLQSVEFFQADLLQGESVRHLVSNIQPDIIVNLAAISSVGVSWGIPQTTVMVNVVGALNILEAAKQQKIKPKVMFIGSSEEYQTSDEPMDETTALNANNPYGISKVTQENFARLYREQYDLKVYCVRPFNHTGVGQKDTFVLPSFCKQAAQIERSGKPGVIRVGNLAARRDFSHVKDIVRAYRMILEKGDCDKIYNVGSGISYGLDEMLNYIVGLSRQKIHIETDARRFRPVDTPVVCCNRDLIGRDLGWEPRYTVFDALQEMFDDYLKTDKQIPTSD